MTPLKASGSALSVAVAWSKALLGSASRTLGKGETCSQRYRISKETEKFEAR